MDTCGEEGTRTHACQLPALSLPSHLHCPTPLSYPLESLFCPMSEVPKLVYDILGKPPTTPYDDLKFDIL
ncbi:hypothetical protein ACTXT7_001628 [Hymenolepis weldensis]